MEIGPAGEVGIIDLQADLNGLLEATVKNTSLQLNLQGLSPVVVRGDKGVASGEALKIERESQELTWGEQRTLWKLYENVLYQVFRIVRSVDFDSVELPDTSLEVDFHTIGVGESPDKVFALARQKMDAGVLSRKQYLIRYEDMSPEEADQTLADIALEQVSLLSFPPRS